MAFHEIEIECPPEGMTRKESYIRTPIVKGCKCDAPKWKTLDDVPIMVQSPNTTDLHTKYYPGQKIITPIFWDEPGQPIICVYTVHLVKPKDTFDVIEAVDHDTKKIIIKMEG